MLNRVEIRRSTWPLQNIPLFLPSKTPGLLLLYVLGHCPFVLGRTAQSTLLHLAESGQTVYPYTLQNSSGCFCPLSRHHNTSNPVPLEAMHAHAITLLHHVSQMMLYALAHELFQASPYFFLPVILVQVDLNFSCPKSAFPEVVLDVFWQSLIRPCLQLVVNPLYLLS